MPQLTKSQVIQLKNDDLNRLYSDINSPQMEVQLTEHYMIVKNTANEFKNITNRYFGKSNFYSARLQQMRLYSGTNDPIKDLKYYLKYLASLKELINEAYQDSDIIFEEAVKPSINLVHFESGKPYTAHRDLSTMLTEFGGKVRVFDPYFGEGSLPRLELLKNCESIEFLTCQPGGGETKATVVQKFREFRDEMNKDHPGKYEFKRLKGARLHDRYILTEDELILLGQGIKDIGAKESFAVRLSKSVAESTVITMNQAFKDRWAEASELLSA